MWVLSWVQSKINGKEKKNLASKNFSAPEISHKEAADKWPQGLLAIGTFGNQEPANLHAISTPQSIPELTEDETEKIERELENLLLPEPVGRRGKTELIESKRNTKSRRPISFLLRKIFLCSGGFAPAPSFTDLIFESETEKLLRRLVAMKVYPQNSTQMMKLLGRRAAACKKAGEKMVVRDKEEREGKTEDGCRWVKTDSEYIVLEI